MERYERLATEPDFILEYDKEDKQVLLYVQNRWIRLNLRTPMLYTHDGNLWIKTSGGKALTAEDIKAIFKITDEQIQTIKQRLSKTL